MNALSGGLYCFAWDAESGADAFVEQAKARGIGALYMAATYHAAWLLRPGAVGARAFMPLDGAAYFGSDASLYGEIRPRVAPECVAFDALRATQNACQRHGLELWAWTIGAHNTPLGLEFPEACVRNAFDDELPHALCPAHPDVRAYLVGLCADLSHNVGVTGLALESFGYAGWKHGHHHERDLTGLSPLEARLMGLCFSSATRRAMRARGLDVAPVREGVRQILDDAMRAAPDRPDGHPSTIEQAQALVPELERYLELRREIERDLLSDVRRALLPHTRMWHNPGAQTELFPPTTTVGRAAIYGQNADKARQTLSAAREKLAPAYELHAGMRLGMGLPASQREFNEIARAARKAGAARLVFYNASESPPRMLDWIPAALAFANDTNGSEAS